MDRDLAACDRMIEDGASMRQIASAFPTLTDAMHYYATYQQQAFGPQTVGEICCVCRSQADLAVAYDWEGQLPYDNEQKLYLWLALLSAGIGHAFYHGRPSYARFRTHHPMCFRCWQTAQRRARSGNASDKPAAFVFAIGLIALAGGIVYPWYAGMKEAEAILYQLGSVAGLLLAAAALWWEAAAGRRAAIGPLRDIARSPFRCKGVWPAWALNARQC